MGNAVRFDRESNVVQVDYLLSYDEGQQIELRSVLEALEVCV